MLKCASCGHEWNPDLKHALCPKCEEGVLCKGERATLSGASPSSALMDGVGSWFKDGVNVLRCGNQEVFDKLEDAKFDEGKLRMGLIPPEADIALAEVLTGGAEKYGDRNWEKGFAWSRALDALKRHLAAWEQRDDVDDESGLNHMKHVLCNAAFLVAFIERGVGTDDRSWGAEEGAMTRIEQFREEDR